MITIERPYIHLESDTAYLKAAITISDDTIAVYKSLPKKMRKVHWRTDENYPPMEWNEGSSELWFSVDKTFMDYICTDTADAFVVALLWYAMVTGSDIVSKAPVSEKMLFSINRYLIPALCKSEDGYRRIRVCAPTTDRNFCGDGVGTGMSCGVDSLYTLEQYVDNVPEKMRLTHLAYFNMGAIFSAPISGGLAEFYKKTDEMSLEKFSQANNVANDVSLPIIYICSNVDADFYRGAYGYTAVYRNCACVLALQKLFRTYYCSSAGWPDYFDLSLTEGSEHYESLLCNCLSTESCCFVLSDYCTRIEKTEKISDWSIAQRYLDVCFNFNNCGHCPKCYRTLLTLDILGKVDNFGGVFDVQGYRKNKAKAIGWLLYAKEADSKDDNGVFAREIYKILLEKRLPIPASAYVYMMKDAMIGFMVKIYHMLKNL